MGLNILEDVPPSDTETTNTQSSFEYACQECGVEIFYAGRGRKPRFCDQHRKGAPKVSSPGRKTTTDSLIESITSLYSTVGMSLSFYPPTFQDGMMVAQGAEAMAESWRTLLDRDKKIRAMWEKVFTVSGYGAVIGAHALVLVPIMQNHKILPAPKVATDGR